MYIISEWDSRETYIKNYFSRPSLLNQNKTLVHVEDSSEKKKKKNHGGFLRLHKFCHATLKSINSVYVKLL